MSNDPVDPMDKIIAASDLRRMMDDNEDSVYVFTNGCFDILHAGHATYLFGARLLGDYLIVGLNSDASVRRLKGDKRPLVPQADRTLLLAALAAVDYVVVFEEDTPIETLRILRPQIHAKGGDYDPEKLPETPVVRSWGGHVEILPFMDGHSTTDVVKTIVERYGT